MKKAAGLITGGLAILLASPLVAPQLLAFPYYGAAGGDRIYSTAPIDAANLQSVLDRSRALLAASPIAQDHEPRDIFLTDGGWRWQWLALRSAGSFGLTRAHGDDVIINSNDITQDEVRNGLTPGGLRSLSGVIAHEKCHGTIIRHFGMIRIMMAPQMLIEGYCDHVAQESSLNEQEVAALETSATFHPALPYYHGRLKVAALLEANGGSVDHLFEDWR